MKEPRLRRLRGEQKILLAVIGLACRDARAGNGHAEEALEFLRGDGFARYTGALGLRPEALRAALEARGEWPQKCKPRPAPSPLDPNA